MSETTALPPEKTEPSPATAETPVAPPPGYERSRRLGVAPFLNAQPLIWGLKGFHELVSIAPSAMGKALKEGRLDAALVPVAACFKDPSLVLIPAGAVGSKGPVRTVRLLLNDAPGALRRLFVDDRSQTSVLQARLTLKRWFGVKDLEVKAVDMKHFRPNQTKPWEGVLQFGDDALAAAPTGMGVMDLGEEWFRYTGKPFVNAVWAARDGALARELEPQLAAAREEGLKHLEEAAGQYHGLWQFKRADAKAYLEKNIRYGFGPEEQEGMAEFKRLLVEEGLL